MQRTLIFANRKGGSGKTTVAVNLAAALGGLGKRVLVVDLDPQCHATYISGLDPYDNDQAADFIRSLQQGDIVQSIRRTEHGLFDVLPCYHAQGANLTTLLPNPMGFAEQTSAYAFVLVDTPPSGENPLYFAVRIGTEVMVPLPLHFLALEGLAQLMGLMQSLSKHLNPTLKLSGIIPVMTDARHVHSSQVMLQLREIFKDHLFLRRIRMDMALADAAWMQKPLRCVEPNSKTVLDFQDLAEQVQNEQCLARGLPFCLAAEQLL